MSRILFIVTLGALALGIPGTPRVANGVALNIHIGKTIVIQPNAWYPVAFQFADGRISVGSGNYNPTVGKWSTDGGQTWSDGPAPPDEASIELGGGEVLSLGFHTEKRADGKYTLAQRRSLDGWKTITAETGVLDIPKSVPCGGDGGESNPGFLMDHSILKLKDGRLMATMYGNYDEDKTPADGYPASFNCRKYRTITVFSADKGKTWGNPVTVATAAALTLSREGPCEADLTRAPNGDILCAMRANGQPGNTGPSYVCRSTDEGQTWSTPSQLLDRGVWPNLLTMGNGVVASTTGRDGDWLTFSKDNGLTWQDAVCIQNGAYPSTSAYNSIFEVAPNTILAIYDRTPANGQGHEIVGTFITVSVPEPATAGMLMTGGLTLLLAKWWGNRLGRL
jgi:hypothetical protein